MKIWLRVGQAGALESFDSTRDAVAYLNSLKVGKPTNWRLAGVETQNYWGQDYISIFWGDDQGRYVDELAKSARVYLALNLAEAEL